MSSPQGSKTLPTTPSKDSPTSNFFNNLSPINVISSRLSCQAFDNVDVPSPQPVFATPQDRLINSKLWRRPHTLFFPGSQKNCPGGPDDADLAATSLGYPGMIRKVIPMSVAQLDSGTDNKHNNDHQPQDEVCRNISNGVDDFLSIPSEDCENNSCSPSFFLGEADDLARDKEVISFCGNGEQIAYTKEDSVQISAIKSAPTVTNSVAGCNKLAELVSTPNMKPNEASLPQAFQNNTSVYEGEFLISDVEKSSNLNVVDPNLSSQPEKDPAKQKPSSQIVSAAFEEVEKKGGLIGKKVEAMSNSFVDSISSTKKEPITPDKMRLNRSYDPNTMNFRSMDDCPSSSRSYMLRMHDDDFYSSNTEFLGKLGCSVETKCEMLRNTHFHSNHQGILSQMRDASGKNQIPLDQEDLAHHSRGMYKRLQFEDVEKQEQSVAYTGNCMDLNSPHFLPDASTIASNRKSSQASTTNTITMSGRLQRMQSLLGNISCHQLVKADSTEQTMGRFSAVVPRSFGIGLHLNAIGMTEQMSGHIGMKMQVEGLGLKGKTVVDSSCEVLSQGLNNMVVSRNGAEEVSVQLISNSGDSSFGSMGEMGEMGECNNEGHQKPLDIAPDYPSPLNVESLDLCMQPEFSDHHITPCNRKRLLCVEVSKSEDLAQTSIGKKRKKDQEIEGQKRCNCKRSKCLKLYCDCFAAGMFCNTTCACQGCSNNSENEETVSSTRQLIEARNPLAFAPRVVHANGDPKENVDNKHITPPSSRHKRGCNCKKSKCSKKYCECYQAGVGCSLGCRCEGCKNIYGTKEAYGDITGIIVEHQKLEDGLSGESSLEALEVVEAKNKVGNIKQINKRFTLPASLVKGTNANDVARLQLPAICHPASESTFAALSSLESPTSTMNQTRTLAHGEKSDQSSPIIPYNQFDSSSGLNIDSLSPGWNEFTAICFISPLSDHSRSTSRIEQDRTYNAKLFPERNIQSGVSFQHCSAATPPGLFGEGKSMINPVTTGELHYNLTDATPEILKDDHSPIKTVKTSSPNQKRVSPPQRMLHEAGSSFSSPGLKSGRKYVLHSIPQFPSLTPYRNNSKN